MTLAPALRNSLEYKVFLVALAALSIKGLSCFVWSLLGHETTSIGESFMYGFTAWGHWLILAPLVIGRARRIPLFGAQATAMTRRDIVVGGILVIALATLLRVAMSGLVWDLELREVVFLFIPAATGMYIFLVLCAQLPVAKQDKQQGIEPRRKLAVETGRGRCWLPINQVRWIQSQGNYAAVQTGDREYLIRQTMKSLQDTLPDDQFVRIHRSYILRRTLGHEIICRPNGAYVVQLDDGTELPLSRRYRDELRPTG